MGVSDTPTLIRLCGQWSHYGGGAAIWGILATALLISIYIISIPTNTKSGYNLISVPRNRWISVQGKKGNLIVYHPFLFFLKTWILVWKVFRHLCISKVFQPAGCPGTCFQICICICCSCSTSTLLLSFQSYVLESSCQLPQPTCSWKCRGLGFTAVLWAQPVLSGSQPILLEFINLDLFQMALSDFSDAVFCFWFQLCAFFVKNCRHFSEC